MDKLFSVYHFPKKYRNQISVGDTFIYYQGDRHKRENRYYYGTGKIGRVYKTSENDYYAELVDCNRFNAIVPIYKEGGYIEQLDYETIRKSPTPPWQSSIRPLSEGAYKLILLKANGLIPAVESHLQIDLENELKAAMKSYYRDGNELAIKVIIQKATQLAAFLGINTDIMPDVGSDG